MSSMQALDDNARTVLWPAALRWLLILAGALYAAVAGYEFGLRLSSALLGVVLALNAAVMVAVVIDGAIDRARSLWRRLRD
jgi:zinc transporter ZupT